MEYIIEPLKREMAIRWKRYENLCKCALFALECVFHNNKFQSRHLDDNGTLEMISEIPRTDSKTAAVSFVFAQPIDCEAVFIILPPFHIAVIFNGITYRSHVHRESENCSSTK